jgi:1-deoxy-D-xylulose 5-phosphate reductoisomerase
VSFVGDNETRFDRLIAGNEQKLKSLYDDMIELVSANDLRYQQRLDAQSKALDFAATAAKEAVNAALAGADKAAAKTELSADKRFADLGELIKEQLRSVAANIDASANRILRIEQWEATMTGKGVGYSAAWVFALGAVGLVSTLLGIGAIIYAALKP